MTTNIFFENVAKLKHLRKTTKNQNYVTHKIKILYAYFRNFGTLHFIVYLLVFYLKNKEN
jgi:hypothetical protein